MKLFRYLICFFLSKICNFVLQNHRNTEEMLSIAKSLSCFLRKWTLPFAMLAGVAAYYLYTSLHFLDFTHGAVTHVVSIVQPFLIFVMLMLTFLKIRPRQLQLERWHLYGLLLQVGLFVLCAVFISLLPEGHWIVVIEGGMLCLICPTATAAAVVTGKLGGNQASLTTYTILINLMVALVVPAVVPWLHPHGEMTFLANAIRILSKVFPLLFCPFLSAILLRRYLPHFSEALTKVKDLAFYLWAVSLSLAIAVTMRSIVNSHCPWQYQAGIAASSFLACFLQFAVGRWMGHKCADPITVAQSLGQKNTVFAIWMGYTFLTPVTSIAGGFYSVWHNVYNSYQLAKQKK